MIWTNRNISQIEKLRPRFSYGQIAKRFGVSRSAISGIVRRRKIPGRKFSEIAWSEGDIAVLRHGYEIGIKVADIALTLERTDSTCRCKAHSLGLRHKSRRRPKANKQ